jgi:hypothetical protein
LLENCCSARRLTISDNRFSTNSELVWRSWVHLC